VDLKQVALARKKCEKWLDLLMSPVFSTSSVLIVTGKEVSFEVWLDVPCRTLLLWSKVFIEKCSSNAIFTVLCVI